MPKNRISKSRRKFFKTIAAGAGATAIGTLSPTDISAKTQGWTNGMAINPNIPNTRVVCCKDPAMVTKSCLSMNMASFDPLTPTCDSYTAVVPSVLQANMDGMAMALAQKSTAADAWSTIFQKPAAKAWSAVNVAIKPNANPEVRVRVAILDKICKELNKLGVPYGNIIIYDMINMYFSGQAYALFVGNGLPSGVQISGGGGGGSSVWL